MGKKRYLITGVALILLFTVYALTEYRHPGPADKVIQFLLLIPAVICLAVFSAPGAKRDLSRTLSEMVNRPPTGLFLITASVVVFSFSAFVAFGPLEGIPKGGDEVGYFFQSRIFAAGELAAPVPEVERPQRFFPCRHLIMEDGKWIGQYTPTHSLLMAPFTAAGLSALLGPIESVITLLGIFLLVRQWAGERAGRMAVILLSLSPFFLFMSATHMAHTSNLMFVTWALYLLTLNHFKQRFLLTAAAGFLLALGFTTKPYPIVAWGLFLIAVYLPMGKKGFRNLLGITLGAIPPMAGFAYLNYYYTGDPLKTTYQIARAGKLMGFGENKSWYPNYGDYDHTAWRGIKNVARQIGVGTVSMFGWPLMSLAPVAVALTEARRDKRILWLFSLLVLMSAMLLLHAWPAIEYGPRHYFTFIPVVLVLTLTGLRTALRIIRKRWGHQGGTALALTLAGFFCISLFLYFPEEIETKSGPWQTIDGVPFLLARSNAVPPAIIFMQANDHGYPNILSGITHNLPDLSGDFIFCAHQLPGEDMEFMDAYPHRNPYLFWFDGTESHLEPWTRSLADSLTPTRDFNLDPLIEALARSNSAGSTR